MQVLFHHRQSLQLRAFDLLRIEIVSFRDVQIRNYVLHRVVLKLLSVQRNRVPELRVRSLLKVVGEGELRWVVLEHDLTGYGRHQTSTE